MKLSDLTPLPDNPRKITDAAIEKLKQSIKRDGKFMEARPIIVDPDGVILGGNQRHRACLELGMDDIPDEWVRRVDWTEDEARRFAVVDNAPAGMSGEFDLELLAGQHALDELIDMGFDAAEFGKETEPRGNGDGIDDTYTKKIVAPIYEPKGEKPPISAMIDRYKTQRLIDEIEGADLPDNVSEFLKYAAERHTVFHFRQIAEFYCHADKQVQELMEKSGMVIIDFDKAIEYGFVHMADRLIEFSETERAENEY